MLILLLMNYFLFGMKAFEEYNMHVVCMFCFFLYTKCVLVYFSLVFLMRISLNSLWHRLVFSFFGLTVHSHFLMTYCVKHQTSQILFRLVLPKCAKHFHDPPWKFPCTSSLHFIRVTNFFADILMLEHKKPQILLLYTLLKQFLLL